MHQGPVGIKQSYRIFFLVFKTFLFFHASGLPFSA